MAKNVSDLINLQDNGAGIPALSTKPGKRAKEVKKQQIKESKILSGGSTSSKVTLATRHLINIENLLKVNNSYMRELLQVTLEMQQKGSQSPTKHVNRGEWLHGWLLAGKELGLNVKANNVLSTGVEKLVDKLFKNQDRKDKISKVFGFTTPLSFGKYAKDKKDEAAAAINAGFTVRFGKFTIDNAKITITNATGLGGSSTTAIGKKIGGFGTGGTSATDTNAPKSAPDTAPVGGVSTATEHKPTEHKPVDFGVTNIENAPPAAPTPPTPAAPTAKTADGPGLLKTIGDKFVSMYQWSKQKIESVFNNPKVKEAVSKIKEFGKTVINKGKQILSKTIESIKDGTAKKKLVDTYKFAVKHIKDVSVKVSEFLKKHSVGATGIFATSIKTIKSLAKATNEFLKKHGVDTVKIVTSSFAAIKSLVKLSGKFFQKILLKIEKLIKNIQYKKGNFRSPSGGIPQPSSKIPQLPSGGSPSAAGGAVENIISKVLGNVIGSIVSGAIGKTAIGAITTGGGGGEGGVIPETVEGNSVTETPAQAAEPVKGVQTDATGKPIAREAKQLPTRAKSLVEAEQRAADAAKVAEIKPIEVTAPKPAALEAPKPIEVTAPKPAALEAPKPIEVTAPSEAIQAAETAKTGLTGAEDVSNMAKMGKMAGTAKNFVKGFAPAQIAMDAASATSEVERKQYLGEHEQGGVAETAKSAGGGALHSLSGGLLSSILNGVFDLANKGTNLVTGRNDEALNVGDWGLLSKKNAGGIMDTVFGGDDENSRKFKDIQTMNDPRKLMTGTDEDSKFYREQLKENDPEKFKEMQDFVNKSAKSAEMRTAKIKSAEAIQAKKEAAATPAKQPDLQKLKTDTTTPTAEPTKADNTSTTVINNQTKIVAQLDTRYYIGDLQLNWNVYNSGIKSSYVG